MWQMKLPASQPSDEIRKPKKNHNLTAKRSIPAVRLMFPFLVASFFFLCPPSKMAGDTKIIKQKVERKEIMNETGKFHSSFLPTVKLTDRYFFLFFFCNNFFCFLFPFFFIYDYTESSEMLSLFCKCSKCFVIKPSPDA